MRIQVNYRLEDLREALRFVELGEVRRPRPSAGAVVAWLIFLALTTAMFYFLRASPQPNGQPAADPETVPVDPVLDIITTMIPAIVILLILVISLWRSWRNSRWSPRKKAATRSGMIVTMVIIYAIALLALAGFLLVNRATTSFWHATRDQLVLLRVGPWIVVFVLLIAFSLLYRRWQPRQQWLANAGHRRETLIELDDQGARMHDSLTLIDLKWEAFVKARETPNLLLLESEDARRWMIPKRAFSDASEIDRARALIQNKIADSRFLVQPGGFAVLPKPVVPVSQ